MTFDSATVPNEMSKTNFQVILPYYCEILFHWRYTETCGQLYIIYNIDSALASYKDGFYFEFTLYTFHL